MSRHCSINCAGILLDVYDSERVPTESPTENNYYVTPGMAGRLQAWLSERELKKITTADQITALIEIGYIGAY